MKEKIIQQINQKPGIHFRELERQVGYSKSTLNHHIGRTEKVEEEKIRGYRRFYPVEISEKDRNLLAALNHSPRGEILYELQQEEDKKLTEISEDLNKSPATVSQHLKVLKNAGIIEKDRKYHLTKKNARKVKEYTSSILEERVDNFIDMWE